MKGWIPALLVLAGLAVAGARRGGAAAADRGGPWGRLTAAVLRATRDAAAGRGAGSPAASLHGAERALEPARRRLPVRRAPGPRPARAPDGEALDVPRRRLRVGDVRLARADRDGVRGGGGAEAAAARAADAGDARGDAAPAARAGRRQPLHGLRGRRLLLPRPPRPRGDPDDDAARVRGAPDGRRHGLRDRAQLRPHGCRAAGGQDHLGAAGLERAAVVRVDERRRRDGRPGERHGALAAAGGEDRELVRGRGHGRGLRRHRRGAVPPGGGRRGRPRRGLARDLRELGRAEARAGERGVGHDADADGRRPRRDHRQRRPDERARLPARAQRGGGRGGSAASRSSSAARARPTSP